MSLFKSAFEKCLLFSLLVMLTCIGAFCLARADVPDMMINTDGTSQIHNEEQIWVSPVDSNVVMIVWRDFRLGYRRVGLGVSYDGGHTWTDSLLSGGAFYRYSDPCISGDRFGNFYPLTMNYESGYGFSDFSVWKTTDNGASWSGPYYVLGSYASYLEDKEFLAIDRTGGTHDGNCYVAWARFPNPTRIMFCRSTTGGVTWEDTLIVGDPDDFGGNDAGQFTFPFVDADGNVYVIWRGWEYISGDWYKVQRMVKSTDGGQTFTEPEIIFVNNSVSQAPGGINIYNSVCVDVDITNGPYHGNIYLTVPDGVEDGPYYHADILFMKSSDGGENWTDPIRINDDPPGLPINQFHQWITVNQKGAIIVLFYDQRNHPPQYRLFDAYTTFSFDGGETFTPNYRVSDVSSDPYDAMTGKEVTDFSTSFEKPSFTYRPEISKAGLLGEYIGVVAYYDQVHCTWTDTRDGNQNVYYSNFRIPLLSPRPILPDDGSYQLTLSPTFKWTASGYFNETTYGLEISTDSTFASIDFIYTGVDSNVFTVTAPLSEVEYFWRVRAFWGADTSGYSQVWSFDVDATAPDIPMLLSPADGETVGVFMPALTWSEEVKGSPVFYTLQVADDSLFTAGPEFYEYTNIYDTTFTMPVELTDLTIYFWRVRAADELGHVGDWQEHPFQFYMRYFLCGDANNNSVVGPEDVVYLINYLFRGGDPPSPYEAGDVNIDDVVNSSDVVYLINYLFRGGPPPCEP